MGWTRRERWVWIIATVGVLAAVVPCAVLIGLYLDPAFDAPEGLTGDPILARLASKFHGAGFNEQRQVWLVNARAMRLLLSRCIFIAVAMYGGLLLVGLHRRWRLQMHRFFLTPRHPVNLAIFRVAVFGILLVMVTPNWLVWWASLPQALQFPPETGIPSWGALARWSHWPMLGVDAQTTQVLVTVFRFFCWTALLGLFSRTSAIIVTIIGLYLLGIPQWFGKVNHYHHVLWFSAVLAASRCGDALSIDALIASWRRADRGIQGSPGAATIYGLPVAFVWLLFGVIYFFPGFHKWWVCGVDWFTSDNFRILLHNKWRAVAGGMLPALRIDQSPWLYRAGALVAVGFEIVFIVAIFWPRARMVFALVGVGFHVMIRQVMHISFWHLQYAYVIFFDWHRILHWFGARLMPQIMYVLYDGNCKLCRRTIALLRVFDLFGRITWINALDRAMLDAHGLGWLNQNDLLHDMHAVVARRKWRGYDAYRALSSRILVLWPLLPMLYLPPVASVGAKIYRRVADSRLCSITQRWTNGGDSSARPHSTRVVMIVGTVLAAGIAWCGLVDARDSWPLASYPTFAGFVRPQTTELEIVLVGRDGSSAPIDRTASRGLVSARGYALMMRVLNTRDETLRRARLRAVWQALKNANPTISDADRLSFYRVRYHSHPQRWLDPPVERILVDEMAAPDTIPRQ